MRLIVLGNIGSDAGYWYHDATGWHHEGGWASGSLVEVQRAVGILAQISQLKTPGLANGVSERLAKHVENEVSAHIKDTSGGVILVVNQA